MTGPISPAFSCGVELCAPRGQNLNIPRGSKFSDTLAFPNQMGRTLGVISLCVTNLPGHLATLQMGAYENMEMPLPRSSRSLLATVVVTSLFWILILSHWNAGVSGNEKALFSTNQRDILQEINNATLGVGCPMSISDYITETADDFHSSRRLWFST